MTMGFIPSFALQETREANQVGRSFRSAFCGFGTLPPPLVHGRSTENSGHIIFTCDCPAAIPMSARPLVCRLHPYAYTEKSIHGLELSCKISSQPEWQATLERMGMALDTARTWHQQLYAELNG